MALAFITPIKAIASIGIGAGDIAVIAGAGRAVGNWIKARYFDQSLQEIVNGESLLLRPGLVDPSELSKRWSKELIIFQNGRILPLQQQDVRKILDKIDYGNFTWYMTLVTAALTAATSEQCKIWVITQVLFECVEHDEGKTYLEHEIGRNLESWLSIAITRKIVEAAHRSWAILEVDRKHLPGLIPFADRYDLKEFILWLSGGSEGGKHSREFRTASSDTIAFAMMLRDLGLSQLVFIESSANILESQLAVIFDETRISHGPAVSRPKRRGMRINLTNPEEVISLWPGSSMQNNRRREIFVTGFGSVNDINIRAAQLISGTMLSQENFQPIFAFEYIEPNRTVGPISKLYSEILLVPSERAVEALSDIIKSWSISSAALRSETDSILRLNPDSIDPEHLTDIQVFMLGYYYGLLRPLIETSGMSVLEAFASWTWNDLEIIQVLRLARKLHGNRTSAGAASESRTRVEHYERHFILQIATYLFAGADLDQVRGICRGCCGVKGKLVLMDKALLGDADDAKKISRFALLDIDGSCLPSNMQGLMLCGNQEQLFPTFPQNTEAVVLTRLERPSAAPIDFTSLIEPNWSSDLNTCVVTYRHHGRLVHRANAEAIYNAILASSPMSDLYYGDDGQFRQAVDQPQHVESGEDTEPLVTPIELREFYDASLPVPIPGIGPEVTAALYVASHSLPKIRSCIAAAYNMETIETLHLSHLRARPTHVDGHALVINLDSCQVLIG